MPCKLCLQNKTLVDSHIIPEFCYESVYDNLHRLNELSTDPKERNKCYKQKGIREKLLCTDCESLISPSEKYVREVFYGGVEIKVAQDAKFLVIENIDYNRFKLFQLSILWRASVSTHDFFNAVQLGPHEDKIRRMILTQDPGEPHEYGCVVNAILTGEQKTDVVDGLITTPEKTHLYGHRCYRFIFGGSFWIYVVSKHSDQFPYRKLFVSKEGRLVILKTSAEETEYFTKFAQKLKQDGKLNGF